MAQYKSRGECFLRGFARCFAVFSPEKFDSGCEQFVIFRSYYCKITNEFLKVASESKETVEFFSTKRPGIIKNCIDLVKIRAYSFIFT